MIKIKIGELYIFHEGHLGMDEWMYETPDIINNKMIGYVQANIPFVLLSIVRIPEELKQNDEQWYALKIVFCGNETKPPAGWLFLTETEMPLIKAFK